jgi:hypothetical protein
MPAPQKHITALSAQNVVLSILNLMVDIEDDQNVSVHLMMTIQKVNSLNLTA